MHADPLDAQRGVRRHHAVQPGLEPARPRAGQGEGGIAAGQQPYLQRARDQHAQQQHEKDPGSRGDLGALRKRARAVGLAVVRLVVLVKKERHQQTDADPKDDREDDPRQGNVHPDLHAGERDGQDVDRRADEQKGDRRPQSRALLVDAGKEGHDRARADGEHKTAHRRRGVRDPLGRVAAQVLCDRFLGYQCGQCASDEKGRQQTEQHVRGQVGRQRAQPGLQQLNGIRQDVQFTPP